MWLCIAVTISRKAGASGSTAITKCRRKQMTYLLKYKKRAKNKSRTMRKRTKFVDPSLLYCFLPWKDRSQCSV